MIQVPTTAKISCFFLKCCSILQIDYIFLCVYCNRSQMTSQHVKNKKLLCFTRCDVFCDLLQYTHTEKVFVLYNKNSNGLLKDFGGMKKEKQLC